jgi:UDP-N-acetylglucosamine 4,6-dehydratase/5-epimerase
LFEGKNILITGGTGSLGQALTKRLLSLGVNTIRIFSRNENKQINMESKFNDRKLRFLIGDIRDLPRLNRAMEDIDIVFHAAALKHVPLIEYNPFEAIKTNVIGSQNVIDACINQNVELSVCIGTDKSVSPLNTYGATKLLMEKLFITAKNYTKARTKFIALRYGNVLGSSGSVIPKFIEQINSGKKISITHPDMTRFSISMNEALDFILESSKIGKGGEIFVPKLKAYSISELKDAVTELLEDTGIENIGIRPGEKMYETLINQDEIRYAWELENKYIIFNPLIPKNEIKNYTNIKEVKDMKIYSSDKVEKISKLELKETISRDILSKK